MINLQSKLQSPILSSRTFCFCIMEKYCHIYTLTGGKQCAEGFGQRESVTVQGVGPAESAEQSQNRAESTQTKQG